MKKIFLAFIPLIILVTGCAGGAKPAGSGNMSLDQAIQAAAENIENNVQDGQKIAVLNFSSPTEQFSAYVLEELSTRLVNGKKLVVVDRRELDLIRQEENFQMSGEVSDESAQSIGKKLGAQLIVSGSLSSMGHLYRFRIRALSVESAAVEAASAADIRTGDTRVAILLSGARPVSVNVQQPSAPAVQPAKQPAPATVTPAATPQQPVPDNMVRINGGIFMMGSPANEPQRIGDETQHQVTVNSFYMGKYLVTQKDYQEVMGTSPSNFKGDNLPVEKVSWYDAIEYCNKRSQREGLTPAYTIEKSRSDPNNKSENDTVRWVVTWNRNANGYRLPTEAEWEYACRAGMTTPFNTGNNITTGNANYNGNNPYNNNAKGTYRAKTTAVGSFAPNPLGLYDMHGNVFEWCWDWYGSYSSGAQMDPGGAVSGSYRVLRGGSWDYIGSSLRSASRLYFDPSGRVYAYGFRLVRSL
jgi:formylglycine-generating enzyme required for sulfatase activity